MLLIVIDDMNDWVGPLNDGRRGKPLIPTPSLRALAREGTLFANAHTPAPMCLPARASLVTGLYPRNRLDVADTFGTEGFDDTVTLAEHFRNHGYRTVSGGKVYPAKRHKSWRTRSWDKRQMAFRRPYEKRHGPPMNGLALSDGDQFDWGAAAYPAEKVGDARLAAWAVEHLRTLDTEQPFFLGVGFQFPHLPWYLPPRWLEATPLESVALPAVAGDDMQDLPPPARDIILDRRHPPDHQKVVGAGAWRQAIRHYVAANRFVDEMLGRVLDGLRESRHYRNTIVAVFSDNGFHLGEKQAWRKDTPWEESTRVPLVIRFPPQMPAGVVVRAPASLVDVYPTLVDLAGLPPPPHELDGISLASLAAGVERIGVVTAIRTGHLALRTEHWRYIRYAAEHAAELYDHRQDPMERANLLAEPDGWTRHEDRLRRYNAFLDRYHPSVPMNSAPSVPSAAERPRLGSSS